VPITNHDFTNIPKRYVGDKTIKNKVLQTGDLIRAKGNVVCSNFCTAFRVKEGWNPLYVYYYWQNVYNHGAFFNFEGKISGIKNLQLDNAMQAIEIEYLPLESQNKIVNALSSIDSKIKVNRQINDNLPMLDHSSKGAEARRAA
jgi:restriction endonuclease S subunit